MKRWRRGLSSSSPDEDHFQYEGGGHGHVDMPIIQSYHNKSLQVLHARYLHQVPGTTEYVPRRPHGGGLDTEGRSLYRERVF